MLTFFSTDIASFVLREESREPVASSDNGGFNMQYADLLSACMVLDHLVLIGLNLDFSFGNLYSNDFCNVHTSDSKTKDGLVMSVN